MQAEENKILGTEENLEKKTRLYDAKKGQWIIFIALLVLIVLLPVGRIVSDRVGLNDTMIVQSMFMLAFFGITLVIILLEGINKRISWKKYALPYGCLLVSWLFSFVMSFDAALPKFAFIGTAYRGEGLLQIGGYYGIFILATLLINEKFRGLIIYVFMGVATIYSIFGIFQFLNIYMFGTLFSGMASLGFGNPNFFAGFTVIFAGVAMGGFWLYKDNSKFFHPVFWWSRKVWFLFVAIAYIGCITSKSSVVYVGLIMMFLLLTFLNIVSKKKAGLQIIEMLILLIFVMLIFNLLSDGSVWREATSTAVQIQNEGSVFGDSVGTGRMKILKEMLALLPMYWLYGCGIEQLGYVHLFTYGLTDSFQVVDRSHNEYLDLWLTRGIIPLILYLVFLFSLFIPGIMQYIKKNRYEADDISMMAVFPFFGYIAQAFFNISMITTAPYFWLICGFLLMKRKSSSSVDVVQEADISKEEVKEVSAESVSVVKEE